MAVKKPVKLTWRREEDFAHDQYRPFALVNVKATLDTGKRITGVVLPQRVAVDPRPARLARARAPSTRRRSKARCACPMRSATHVVEWVPLPAGIPVGFWRSVGSSINAFAVESMMDELAMAAGIDPFTFRYNHLTRRDARFEAVLVGGRHR